MKELIQYGIVAGLLAVCFFSSRWCFVAMVLYLPTVQYFPQGPIPFLNTWNLMLLPVLARALSVRQPKGIVPRRDPIAVASCVFLIFVFISWARVYFISDVPREFIEDDGFHNNMIDLKEIATNFILYFCARRMTRDPASVRYVLGAVVGGYLIEAVTGAREFLFSGAGRATAHLGQPNKLGHFLAGYMMIPLAFLLASRGKYFFYALGAVMAGILGLLGAVSRGALVATGVSVVLLALIRRSPWVIVLVAVVWSSSLWAPQKVVDRFESSMVESGGGSKKFDTENEGRVLLWKPGFKMIAEHPLGVGLDQYRYNLQRYGYQGNKLRNAHNLYIQIAAEQGIPCIIAHIVIMLTLALIGYRVSQLPKGSIESCIGLGTLGAIISFMSSSMFGHFFYANNLSGPFWVLAGMTVNLYHGIGVSPEGAEAKKITARSNQSSRNDQVRRASPPRAASFEWDPGRGVLEGRE